MKNIKSYIYMKKSFVILQSCAIYIYIKSVTNRVTFFVILQKVSVSIFWRLVGL